MLAGTLTLAGCGAPTTAVTSPGVGADAAMSAPAKAAPSKAQAPAKAPAQAPVANVGSSANAQAPAADTPAAVSGGSAAQTPAAPAAPAGNSNIGLKGGMGWGGFDFIVFSSNRYPGEGNQDIFVFDPAIDTVLAIVGVNTHDNEINPRISDNGKWLVFQRAWKDHGGGYHRYGKNQDILLYNMDLKLVNTLPALNTEEFDEYQADVSNDGCFIVYVTEVEKYYPEVRLYDVKTGDNWAVPGLNRNFRDVTWPTISANGKRIAYGASIVSGSYGPAEDIDGNETGGDAVTGNPLQFGESNVYVYDIPTGTQLTPPFVNTAFDEYNPDLCLDGSRLLFVSNRLGTEDIFEVNLDTGWTDNLSFLNTDELDEQHPRYLGGSVDRIVFQITPNDYDYTLGYPFIQLRAYNRATATLDLLPVANHLLADSALRAEQPETLP
jgi:Tol biopolymer transport system component